jgi:hypothetical protein
MFFLKIEKELQGRAVRLSNADTLYIAKNNDIYAYDGKAFSFAGGVPSKAGYKLIEPFRLLCRLLRYEIRAFSILSDGTKIASTRQGVYFSEPHSLLLRPTVLRQGGISAQPPMTITVDSNDRILWGEYWGNPKRRAVRLFVSEDKGRTYEPVYEFKSGEIRHVHNIFEDTYENCYWICAGDYGREVGIIRVSKNFDSFDWVIRGEQRYRAVNLFILKDSIIYATDTEEDYNGIYVLDKLSRRVEKICDIPGSSIYATKFGIWYAVSTSVEYFKKYKNDKATLWISRNGTDWQQVYEAQKDIWSKKYFQFGSIVLPQGRWKKDTIVFSGQALKGIDGRVFWAEVCEQD